MLGHCGLAYVLAKTMTPLETAEALEEYVDRCNQTAFALPLVMSEAAYHLVRQHTIIEELRAEIATLLAQIKYD